MIHKKIPIGTLIALMATGLFLTVISSSTLISGVVIASQSISSGGVITSLNVEIFSNIDCTQPCNNINWGTLSPGEIINQTIYIKNTGNKPITLSMITENWTPINATNYISLTWDKENAVIDTDQISTAILELETASEINSITDFNFNINIIGLE